MLLLGGGSGAGRNAKVLMRFAPVGINGQNFVVACAQGIGSIQRTGRDGKRYAVGSGAATQVGLGTSLAGVVSIVLYG